MAGRPKNEALDTARMTGDPTYEGSVHSACGTHTRYTKTQACVHCARSKATARAAAAAAYLRGENGLTSPPSRDPNLPRDPWE